MKDDTIKAILALMILVWVFITMFGLWGGHPEGAFMRIKRLQEQVDNYEKRTGDLEIETKLLRKQVDNYLGY